MNTTVIIPAKISNKQQVEWLERAIQSVIDQTIPVKVLVVLNGCAPVYYKKVEDLIKSKTTSDHPENALVTSIHSKAGLSNARNAGVEACQTEFFLPLDADDTLPRDAVEKMLSAYTDGFVYGSTRMIAVDGKESIYKPKDYDFKELLQKVTWTNGSLQTVENWKKIGGWDPNLTIFEDWEYWIRAGELGICGHRIDEVVYNYFIGNPGSITVVSKANPEISISQKKYIEEKHKDSYEGRLSDMCCGRGETKTYNTRTIPSTITNASKPTPKEGFVTIQYVGGNYGSAVWYGVSTGQRYTFSMGKPFQYVYPADARTGNLSKPGLLELREHAKVLFVEVKE